MQPDTGWGRLLMCRLLRRPGRCLDESFIARPLAERRRPANLSLVKRLGARSRAQPAAGRAGDRFELRIGASDRTTGMPDAPDGVWSPDHRRHTTAASLESPLGRQLQQAAKDRCIQDTSDPTMAYI